MHFLCNLLIISSRFFRHFLAFGAPTGNFMLFSIFCLAHTRVFIYYKERAHTHTRTHIRTRIYTHIYANIALIPSGPTKETGRRSPPSPEDATSDLKRKQKPAFWGVFPLLCTLKYMKLHFFCIFLPKNLHMSKKSSTFAPAFEIKDTCAEKKSSVLIFALRIKNCGNSSVGRARPCQGRGREFESRFPLFFFALSKRSLNWGPRRTASESDSSWGKA